MRPNLFLKIFFQELNSRDASFTITISGIERSSMQPVFSENLYTVYDGEVLWDRQFQDQIITDRHGHSMFDCNLIDQLKPVKWVIRLPHRNNFNSFSLTIFSGPTFDKVWPIDTCAAVVEDEL